MSRAVIAATVATAALVAVPSVARGAPVPRAAAPVALVAFTRSSGADWSSRTLRGVVAGPSDPGVATLASGALVIAERTAADHVVVAVGTPASSFSSTDLTVVASAPLAAGRALVTTAPSGAITVWYLTAARHLEAVTEQPATSAWVATDVTAATSSEPLDGTPAVVQSGAGTVAYAVTVSGTLVALASPVAPASQWTATDPTDGLTFPALTGSPTVIAAPSDPTAVVVLATAVSGDLIELTDELQATPVANGPWQATDLTALGIIGSAGAISAVGGTTGLATYVGDDGDLIELSMTSGLPDGVRETDLSWTDAVTPAVGSSPDVVASTSGRYITARTAMGDVLEVPTSPTGRVLDVSFLAATGELVASDPVTTGAAGRTVAVAALAGPIAPTPLRRRIVLDATAFDQQHAAYETVPAGSECNRFTAALGRGSTDGCAPGTAAEEWCSDFAQWVWQRAGVPTRGITGWSASFIAWGSVHRRLQLGTKFTAEVGDAIVWGTRRPLYGTHVAIIVAVRGAQIDVVSGNSPVGATGEAVGVSRWGPFSGASSNVNGYGVLGVVTP